MSIAKKMAFTAVVGMGLVASSAASAATITYTGTIAPSTNANTPFSVPQFDLANGSLVSILLSVTGQVSGLAKAENLAGAALITLNVSTAYTIGYTGNPSFVTFSAATSQVFSAGAFDAIIDFGGTSGTTRTMTASGSGNGLVPGGDFSLFTCNVPTCSNVAFNLGALGGSNAQGGSNTISQFTTTAGAGWSVTYNYNSSQISTPEPASMMLVGAGLLGLGLARRRRS